MLFSLQMRILQSGGQQKTDYADAQKLVVYTINTSVGLKDQELRISLPTQNYLTFAKFQ